jgi:phenylalanyl-tRNA synthetase beta chain
MIHPKYVQSMKLKQNLWMGEMDFTALMKLSRPTHEQVVFSAWGAFPSMERDYAILAPSALAADQIIQSALKAAKPLAKSARVFDVYRGAQVPEGMTSLAVRVIFLDETRSLEENDAEQASQKILQAWKKEFGVELRSS